MIPYVRVLPLLHGFGRSRRYCLLGVSAAGALLLLLRLFLVSSFLPAALRGENST